MNINDRVYVKTDGEERREGTILLIEPFNEGVMYLIALPDYPEGIWFFNEKEGDEGIFVTPIERSVSS
ncbi:MULTISPECIES: protein DsrB [Providencia]|uniref:Protein DsrB n=3 Tax=Providencia TaxID=586 RepID=A0AB35L3V3_PRORE|nr:MULTISPECIES: protein DsrB [Providencia]EHZ7765010.1 protein DsrB [Providencia rettgeri]EIJ7168152.1 protein DsrB [Providencia rettgeri]EJD6045963.1 protein DsrB [Providencia rettgeri]ELR5092278.1 protein DsrB [Providencia rettgeri]ELR5106217.1 protein DsrB [Providencia rettgeri]